MSGALTRVQRARGGAYSVARGSANGCGGRRVVAQLGVLHQPVDRVQPEAVDAAVEPEPHHVLHRRHDLGVAPVQVGLLGIERVQVPARRCARRATRPSRRTPPRQLLGGSSPSAHTYQSGCSRNQGCSIDVWQGTRSMSSAGRAVGRGDERVEVGQRAERAGRRRSSRPRRSRSRAIGAGIDRRQPERVDARATAMWSSREAMPAQVAHPVAVGVLEGARIDLVDDRVPPPLRSVGTHAATSAAARRRNRRPRRPSRRATRRRRPSRGRPGSSAHPPAGHVELTHSGFGQGALVILGIDADDQVAAAARAAGHVAADHEADPAEHLALGEALADGEQVPYALGEHLVVGHEAQVKSAATAIKVAGPPADSDQ